MLISGMFSLVLFLAGTILVVVAGLPQTLLSWLRDWLHFRKLANRFPGPPTRPLVGNLFDSGFPPDAWSILKWVMEEVMFRYPAGQIFLGPKRIFLLSDVNDLQIFLMNSKNQSRQERIGDGLANGLGNGLGTLYGEKWRLHYQIMKPGFHQSLLKTYVPVMNRKSDVLIELLLEKANGTSFDVELMTKTFAVDIIFETLFGVPANQQTVPNRTFFQFVLTGQEEMSYRIRSPWLYLEEIYPFTPSGRRAEKLLDWGRRFLDSEVLEKRMEILRGEAKTSLKRESLKKSTLETSRDDFSNEDHEDHVGSKQKQLNILIDLLLQEQGKFLSRQDILDELLTVLLAGFDTTAVSMQFALYFLAKNPQVQEKAIRELGRIFDAAGSTEVTPEALQQMQYVEMIVKETLRMHPPVFFSMKLAGVDTPLASSDLVVPAGADVVISPKKMHMDPKLYPDPHVFDPERFSPENCAKRHPYAFIPFSAGGRNCIGKKFAMLTLKTVISKIIWNYRIQPDESYEPQLLWGISTVTKNGMRIKLLKRSC